LTNVARLEARLEEMKLDVREEKSIEEREMSDEDITQWDDWTVMNMVHVRSVGLALDEERERQDQLFQQFAQTVLGESDSGSPPKISSEDSDAEFPEPNSEGDETIVIDGGTQIEEAEERPSGDLGLSPGAFGQGCWRNEIHWTGCATRAKNP
jgi:hypothetical protein